MAHAEVSIAVFAKAPVPGEVKTRLVPLLGEESAAELHSVLVRRALATARAAALGPVTLWCMPETGHPFFQSCAEAFGVTLQTQRGGHLGERMARALEAMLLQGPGLIIGSDCPALTVDDLHAAARSLATHDAVVQPAEDGGYVLVGLSKPVPGLFEGIDWGEGKVMRDTRLRLRAARATWRELPSRWDVDRPADYQRLTVTGLLAEGPA
ncbi:MAG: TIGR04282 family arsenosugar biosynthesis glycosyltransferase [Betaproteobacteria bacterium]|nr:TIGR04282 family arsenosugar biosynthesis glycosyltransferase [Betaproteobacteria bacterium]